MFTLFVFKVLGKNTKVVPIYGHNIFSFFWQTSDAFNFIQTQMSTAVVAVMVWSHLLYKLMEIRCPEQKLFHPVLLLSPPILVVRPRKGSSIILLDLVIRRWRNAFLCPASGSRSPQTLTTAVAIATKWDQCLLRRRGSRTMTDAHCFWKLSILWYFLEKKIILIFS